MTTTAEMFFEDHHHGYRLTIRRGDGNGRTQLYHCEGMTLEDAAFQIKKYGCTYENVTVLPRQA